LKGFRLKKLVQAAIASAGAALFLLLATLILLGEETSNARAEANAVTFPPVEEFEHYTTRRARRLHPTHDDQSRGIGRS